MSPGRTGRLFQVVGQLDRRPAVGAGHLADQRNGIEPRVRDRCAIAQIVGEQRAPAEAQAHAAGEVAIGPLDAVDVQPVGEDQQLVPGILAHCLPPGDDLLASVDRVLGIDAKSAPMRDPVRRIAEKCGGAERVGQHDEKVSVVGALPALQHAVRDVTQLPVVRAHRGPHHRQLVAVGPDRLDVELHRVQHVAGAGELLAQALLHRLHAPAVPQEAVPPAGAEVGDAKVGQRVQPHHLLPQLRLRAGVQDVELEAPDPLHGGARSQLADDREHRDLPQRDRRPGAAEVDAKLPVLHAEVVLRQPVLAEPGQELRREQALLAVEGVPGEPDAFLLGEPHGARMVELLAKLGRVDRLRKARLRRAVDQGERDRDVPELRPDRLQHEELVDVGVEQAADDRVQLERVVVDPGRDVGRGHRWLGSSVPAGGRRSRVRRSTRPRSETARADRAPAPRSGTGRCMDESVTPSFARRKCSMRGRRRNHPAGRRARRTPKPPGAASRASARRLAPHEDAVVRRHRDILLERHRPGGRDALQIAHVAHPEPRIVRPEQPIERGVACAGRGAVAGEGP